MRREGLGRVEQRLDMVTAPERFGLTVTEVAQLWGVSRPTYYFWKDRYEAEGLAGLEDRPSTPQRSPGRMHHQTESAIVAMRTAHPRWGARRIRVELLRRDGRSPARSTVHRVLVRNHLVVPIPAPPPSLQRFERSAPNELWQMDWLEYELADGTVAHVGSVIDDHSRYCGASRAVAGADGDTSVAVFDAAVAELGFPCCILTDRGSEFTGRGTQTVSDFERHLWPLGVLTINGRGYHPQTQGKIERWHRTLREWLDDHGPFADLEALNAELGRFRHHYNHERPHQGIDDQIPAERWAATPVAQPDAASTADRRRRECLRSTGTNGNVRYAGWIVVLGRAWANTKVKIIDTGDRITITDGGDTVVRTVVPDPALKVLATGRPRSPGRRRRP
jgi:transposase InsO family protein